MTVLPILGEVVTPEIGVHFRMQFNIQTNFDHPNIECVWYLSPTIPVKSTGQVGFSNGAKSTDYRKV